MTDHFPFEFRPPTLFPHTITFTGLPAGYNLSSPLSTSVKIAYILNGTTYVSNAGTIDASGITINGQDVSYITDAFHSASPIPADQYKIKMLDIPIPPGTGNDFYIGDEYASMVSYITFVPDCNAPSGNFTNGNSQIEFSETAVDGQGTPGVTNNLSASAPAATQGCTAPLSGFTKNSEYGPSFWKQPNPNLNVQWLGSTINATTKKVCWHFNATNYLVPGATDAPNVYIELPQNTSTNLINWELNYTYDQILGNASSNNGYFHA